MQAALNQPRRRATGGGGQWAHADEIASPRGGPDHELSWAAKAGHVPTSNTHQQAAEAANGVSWMQPGGGSHQDGTTRR